MNDRYNNYKHALLFTIRRGKSGIRKYYAGWRTSFNFPDRIYVTYWNWFIAACSAQRAWSCLGEQVSFADQTIAAQQVGMKNVAELEGLSVQGAQLTKLVLGLGRVFQVLAYRPEGHSPEQTNSLYLTKGFLPQKLSPSSTPP